MADTDYTFNTQDKEDAILLGYWLDRLEKQYPEKTRQELADIFLDEELQAQARKYGFL